MIIKIFYATETGNAEDLAERTLTALHGSGLEAKVADLADTGIAELREASLLLAVTSTWGDGDPPSEAEDFFGELKGAAPLGLDGVGFSVLALGDESYEQFCQAGKDLDVELERHGATRIHRRVDCDVDFEDGFESWLAGVLAAIAGRATAGTEEAGLTAAG